MNNKEPEFLFYRKLLNDYEYRLSIIHKAVTSLFDIKITIGPRAIEACRGYIYHHNRFTESELQEEMCEWANSGTVQLMHANTLGMLSVNGYPEAECRNIQSYINRIEKYSSNYDWMISTGGEISFDGFTDDEVNWIIDTIKTQTMDSLEKLRNINTYTKYIFKARIRLNEYFHKNDFPENITDDDFVSRGPLVFTPWWMSKVVNDKTAETVLLYLAHIKSQSSPPNMPESLNYFSSNTTNRISIDYTGD